MAERTSQRVNRLSCMTHDFFDQTREIHGLTRTLLPLLDALLPLCDSSESVSLPSLKKRFPDFSPDQRKILQIAHTAFTTQNLSPDDGGILSSSDVLTQIAVRIAAIASIVLALERSGKGRCEIVAVERSPQGMAIQVSGRRRCPAEFKSVMNVASLWTSITGVPVVSIKSGPVRRGGLRLFRPGDSIELAAIRIVDHHFRMISSREYGVSYREDVEYVHEMRVALRRLRTALRVLEGFIPKIPKALANEMRVLSEKLGQARDLDVFLKFLNKFKRQTESDGQGFVDLLIRSTERNRSRAYTNLDAYLLSEEHQAFLRAFAKHLAGIFSSLNLKLETRNSKLSRKGTVATVRSVAKGLVSRRRRKVLKYDKPLSKYDVSQLHRLRIQCKRLRYTAEFFASAYSAGMDRIAKTMTVLQDCLGEFHDCEIYIQRVREFHENLVRRARGAGQTGEQESLHLIDYLRARQEKSLKKAASRVSSFKPAKVSSFEFRVSSKEKKGFKTKDQPRKRGS